MRITPHNRRLAWLLTVALVFMATASGASWRCLNGAPCLTACSMAGSHGKAQKPDREVGGGCNRCADSPRIVAEAAASATMSAGDSCVLKADDRPASTAPERVAASPDSTATLPSLPSPSVGERPIQYASLHLFASSPSHPLTSGRAPPFVS